MRATRSCWAAPAAARPLMQRHGVGLKMAHGVLEICRDGWPERLGVACFAQGTKLGAGQSEPFGQCRTSSRPSSMICGDGRCAEVVGEAAVEAEGLEAPLYADCAGWIAVDIAWARIQASLSGTKCCQSSSRSGVALEERAHMLIAQPVLLLRSSAALCGRHGRAGRRGRCRRRCAEPSAGSARRSRVRRASSLPKRRDGRSRELGWAMASRQFIEKLDRRGHGGRRHWGLSVPA